MIAIGVQTTQVKILFFDWIGKGIWQKALKTLNKRHIICTPGVFAVVTAVAIFSKRENCGNNVQLLGKLPSLEDIQNGLGVWAIVLYSVASATTFILLLQFVLLIRCLSFESERGRKNQ